MMVMGDSVDISSDGELMFASAVVILGACINATIFASGSPKLALRRVAIHLIAFMHMPRS